MSEAGDSAACRNAVAAAPRRKPPKADSLSEEHPARGASQRSMAAVTAGDRNAWLALFTDDALVEDPIGSSPLNPEGNGRQGKEAIGGFWDEVISTGRVTFDIRESYACGSECANVGQITTTFPDGNRAVVQGVYTYRVNEAGDLVALRAFWEYDAMTFETPTPGAGT